MEVGGEESAIHQNLASRVLLAVQKAYDVEIALLLHSTCAL